MATKPLAIAPAMSNLTRWCLIDSTVTPPIGPRRSPKRDVSFDVLDQDTWYACIAEGTLRANGGPPDWCCEGCQRVGRGRFGTDENFYR
jgi:hypothetical protein